PNEFDLWKMRIEKYFLMIDYSLWEVILNGDSPSPTRIVDGAVQIIAPTTVEQSTNESVSVVSSVSTASIKVPVYALPNVDNLSDAVIYFFFASQSNSPRLDNVVIYFFFSSQSNSPQLEEIDLKWQMGLICPRWNATTAIEEVILMVLVAMIGAFRLMKIQKIMPSWHLPPQAHQVLKMSSESDESVPTSPVHDRYKSSEGYHVVPPPYTGTFMPFKPNLVFHDAPTASETVLNVLNVKPRTTKPTKELSQLNRPYAPIIEDWVFDSKDESEVLTRSRLVLFNAARRVTTVLPQTNVKHQRPAKHVVNKPHSPIRRSINHRPAPNSNFHLKVTTVKTKKVNAVQGTKENWDNPQQALMDKGVIDSGCSRHMTGNISYLSDFKEINGGYVAFGGNPKGGKITGNDTECVFLSSDFKLPDENYVLLRVPREHNVYNVDLKNIVPSGDLTCFFAKATLDESNLWHRRLGHINFKTMNKLVKCNLVRGLPSKVFENNHTCVACKKGKQHKASCKTKPVSSISQPLQRMKGIKREFNVARTPQQNGVAERKNRTTRTMLADSLLPILFWAESMNYQPVVAGNQPNSSAGIQGNFDADPQNINLDAAFDVKENESAVHVSPRSSDKPKKHDKKAKREAKGKSP
nr:hypothetical protein [Tanacetum cinerariifolium]